MFKIIAYICIAIVAIEVIGIVCLIAALAWADDDRGQIATCLLTGDRCICSDDKITPNSCNECPVKTWAFLLKEADDGKQ